jgi:uncharacterized protein (DUF305 family)
MKKQSLALAAAALTTVATLTACGNSSNQSSPSTALASQSVTTSSVATTDAHNNADVMFARHMIPHHEQAIQMSDMLLAKQGIDPRVITLANQIKAAQGPEIETMQGWLSQWGQPSMPMQTGDMDMPGQGGMTDMPGHDGMPGMGGGEGMMSDEDMAALQNAQGAAASRLFLTQMIEHHRGAITMAQTEIGAGQYPATIAMARSIVDAQQREINTMEDILPTL